MGLLVLFILSFGALGPVSGSECVSETAKCSRFWEKIEPHKGLMETERELNIWCRKQSAFYECLESVLLAGKDGNISYLPTNLLISKLFAGDLCSEGSTNRKRYLDNAACINRLNTEFCTLPEYLDIVTPDGALPPSRCSLYEKTFGCITASMVMNCGFDAGKVYRNMLKITRYSDEVCDIEASSGIPRCEDIGPKETNVDREEHLSEIYYGLVDRIGNIPEQEVEVETPEPSEEVGDAEETEYEVITETIKNALDSLDDRIPRHKGRIIIPPHIRTGTSLYTDVEKKTDIQSYKKYPIINQFYRGMLFYNYSGLEYSFYWRKPDYTPADIVYCQHMQPSYYRGVVFRCEVTYRDEDPECLSNATVHEPVTPELIRDIDPDIPYDSIVDFGPRPEGFITLEELREAKRLRDLVTSTTESPEYSPITDNPEVTTSATLLHIAEAITKAPEAKHMTLLPEDITLELLSFMKSDNFVPPPMIGFEAGGSYYMYVFETRAFDGIENATCARLNECHPRGRGLFRCQAFPRKLYAWALPLSSSSASEGPYTKPSFEVSETTVSTELPEASGEQELHSSEELITLLFSGDEGFEPKELESTEPGGESFESTESSHVGDFVSNAEDSRVSASEELMALLFNGDEGSEPKDELESTEESVSSEHTKSSHVGDLVSGVADSSELITLVFDGDNRVESTSDARSDEFVQDEPSRLDLPTVQIVVLEQNGKSQQESADYLAPELVYSIKDVKRMGDEALLDLTVSADDYKLFENVVLYRNAPDVDGVEPEYTFVGDLDDI